MAGEGGGCLARALGQAGRGLGPARVVGRSPGHNKVAEREVKNIDGGSVGWTRSGVPIDLSTRRRPTFFICLSSTRHREVVQNPHSVIYSTPLASQNSWSTRPTPLAAQNSYSVRPQPLAAQNSWYDQPLLRPSLERGLGGLAVQNNRYAL